MKKQDFINSVCDNTNLDISRKLTGEVIDSTFNEISNILLNDFQSCLPLQEISSLHACFYPETPCWLAALSS